MRQIKTIAQILLVLSILDHVFAAPIPIRRGTLPDGTPASGGSPHDPLPVEGSTPPQPEVSSPPSGLTPPSHLSATDRTAFVPDSTTPEGSTTVHSATGTHDKLENGPTFSSADVLRPYKPPFKPAPFKESVGAMILLSPLLVLTAWLAHESSED